MTNLCEHTDSKLKDGICTVCSKPAPWHRLNSSPGESTTRKDNFQESKWKLGQESTGQDKDLIDKRLKEASSRVIKISSVFGTMGSVLNVVNYVLSLLLLSATFAISSTAESGGLALLAGIGATIILWGIGWILVALLRGLSAFFLMRGLAHLKSVSSV